MISDHFIDTYWVEPWKRISNMTQSLEMSVVILAKFNLPQSYWFCDEQNYAEALMYN